MKLHFLYAAFYTVANNYFDKIVDLVSVYYLYYLDYEKTFLSDYNLRFDVNLALFVEYSLDLLLPVRKSSNSSSTDDKFIVIGDPPPVPD